MDRMLIMVRWVVLVAYVLLGYVLLTPPAACRVRAVCEPVPVRQAA